MSIDFDRYIEVTTFFFILFKKIKAEILRHKNDRIRLVFILYFSSINNSDLQTRSIENAFSHKGIQLFAKKSKVHRQTVRKKRQVHLVNISSPNFPSGESRSSSAVAQIVSWQLNSFLPLSVFFFSCVQMWMKPISWLRRKQTCVLYMWGTCVCVFCLSVMVLPCAESLYGTEWSWEWRNLSGLGYCRKPSLS